LSPAAPKKTRRVGTKSNCPKVSGTVRNGTLGRERLVPLTILVLGSTCWVVYEPSCSIFNFSTIGTRLVCLCVESEMQYAFFNNFYLDPCVSVCISGENPWSVRKCPVCPKSRTPDTLGQLAAVPLIILVFFWRCCHDYSPRKSILGTRTSSSMLNCWSVAVCNLQ